MIFAKYLPHLYQGADYKGYRTYNFGGGGGGPTQSTVTQTNIPDYLRPQVEALLGAGMQEYFDATPRTVTDPNTGETRTEYDITGTKPYTPYSQTASDYFAPFSRQQQDVFGEAAGMQTPGGFQAGQRMTGMAGQGGLDTAQQAFNYGQLGTGYGGMAAGMSPQAQLYGQQASDIGMMGLRAEELGRDIGSEARGFARQAAGTGSMYEQMATDPRSMQAYMSPYMQNVIETQKQSAIEDAQRAQLGANLGAARQGTYGGARQTLAQTQREAALNKQLSDIQGRGLQDAFQQAQQAQQFGVTTGLQGLQGAQAGLGTALQGGQLGLSGIGQAISGQQAGLQGIGQAGQLYGLGMQGAGVGLEGVRGAQAGYGLTGQMGAQAANIGAAQQQADLSRLGFQGQMGDIQQQREQDIINQQIQNFALAQEMPAQRLSAFNALLRGYATPTSTVSQYQAAANPLQTIGALGTAAGGFGTLMGGGKKEGGVIKLAKGGITDTDAIESYAEDLSIPQLQQTMENKSLPKYVGMPILENKVNEAERMKMAQAMMGQQGQQGQPQSISDALMTKADQLQGITDIVEPIEAAGGGVVAFQAGGIPPSRQQEVEQYLRERADIMGEDEYLKALKARAEKEPSIFDRLSSAGAQVGLAGSMLRDPSQFGTYAQQAAALQGAQRKSAEERELSLLAAQKAERDTKGKAFDVVEGRRQEAAKAEAERKFKSKEADLTRQAQITAANIAAEKPTDMRYYANMKLRAQGGDKEAITIVNAIETYLPLAGLGRVGVAQQGVEVQREKFGLDLLDKAVKYVDSQISMGGPEYTKYRQLQQKDKENAAKNNPTTLAEDFKTEIETTYINRVQRQKQAQPGATPATPPKKPEISGVTGAPEGSSIGQFVSGKGWEVRDKSGKVIGYAQQ